MGLEIDDDHLAGAEAAAVNDALGIHIDQAGFRTGNDQAVVIEGETAGTQTVAIEDRSDLAAIGEGEGGGTIPGSTQSPVYCRKEDVLP